MYRITRAMKLYKPITPAQRTSGLFAEEPVVAGKTLRRNGPPLIITDQIYESFKGKIELLKKAEAITVEHIPDRPKKKVEPVLTTDTTKTVPIAKPSKPPKPPKVKEAKKPTEEGLDSLKPVTETTAVTGESGDRGQDDKG